MSVRVLVQVYGEDVAILAGDALLCRAFELVASTENVPAAAIVQVRLASACDGCVVISQLVASLPLQQPIVPRSVRPPLGSLRPPLCHALAGGCACRLLHSQCWQQPQGGWQLGSQPAGASRRPACAEPAVTCPSPEQLKPWCSTEAVPHALGNRSQGAVTHLLRPQCVLELSKAVGAEGLVAGQVVDMKSERSEGAPASVLL